MNKQPKDEPILAVTYIRACGDDEERCTLQVYRDAASALAGELEHLHEQGFSGSGWTLNASRKGIRVTDASAPFPMKAYATFFKVSDLKPGWAEKFS